MSEEKLIELILSKLSDLKQGNCLSRKDLYSLCGGQKNTSMEEYQFLQKVSALIKEEKLKPFRLKTGRNGGIFRAPNIDDSISVELSSEEFLWLVNHLRALSGKVPSKIRAKMDALMA